MSPKGNSLLEKFSLKIHSDKETMAKLGATNQLTVGLALCMLGFALCTLLMVTPLVRMPDRVITLHIAPGAWLARAGNWLPANLGLASDPLNARGSTACVEFICLLGLVGVCYGLGAFLVRRQTETGKQRMPRTFIWVGALLAGAIYMLTPAMLSHDIIVYASYGRVLMTYHANPYFVEIAAFPHDPFTPINYWARTVSAYGPIWVFVCGLFSLVLQPAVLAYVLAFRLFALAIHLFNTWLVGRTLHDMGRSPRTVTLGMLLYAWNPLVLLESSLGGHNDVFMLMFILLGILLAVRAEQHGLLLRPRGYLPPVVALMLATLVKFTALPILAMYLLLLICKALSPTVENSLTVKLTLRNWRIAFLSVLGAGLAALLVGLAFYAPFWFGHSAQAISASFKNAPSALYSQNSFMRSTDAWLHHRPARTFPFTLLTSRRFWDLLTYLALGGGLLLGMRQFWSRPTIKTFVLVSLVTMSAILLITPWFFSWYVTWIVGLAVLCLPARQSRIQSALLAFTFAFSFSALLTYLFTNGYQPFDSRAYLLSVLTTLPPTCAFLFTLLLWQPARHSTIIGGSEAW